MTNGTPLFAALAKFVTRYWAVVTAGWTGALIILLLVAPSINSVQSNDDNLSLPANVPSRLAIDAIRNDFGTQTAQAVAALAVERPGGLTGLPGQPGQPNATPASQATDWQWIVDRTETIREHKQKLPADRTWDVLTPTDPNLFGTLVSRDGQAAVIEVGLPHNFVSRDSIEAVDWLKEQIANVPPPPGLAVAVSGSAGFGHDYAAATKASLDNTTRVTVLAVIVILLLTYRALLAAAVSLLTVTVAVIVSVEILAIGGQHGWSVSTIVQLFTIVIGFGAGVDFSLFFLSRYHEELGWMPAPAGRTQCRDAVVAALAGTGPAILASAATVAAGLTLMCMADFRVFSTAGPVVAISVAIACLASLTLVPALAFLIGPRTFWPRTVRGDSPQITQITQISMNKNLSNLRNLRGNPGFWDRLAGLTVRFPVPILLVGLAVLVPLAVLGWKGKLVYDTQADLPAGNESIRGAAMFGRHFQRGEMAPVKVVVELDGPLAGGFWAEVAAAVDTALAQRDRVQQVRSLLHPVGIHHPPDEKLDRADSLRPQPAFAGMMLDRAYRQAAMPRYLGLRNGDRPQWRAALWELAIDMPPFSNPAMDSIEPLRETVRQAVASVPAAGRLHPNVLIAGDTAQMRDLRLVTDRDFRRVGALVVVAIIVIVTLVVGDWLVAIFVMLATILTYGAVLALTAWTFGALFGIDGLDWKVNFFLFVILVAVGQDYNLFILTRIRQELRGGQAGFPADSTDSYSTESAQSAKSVGSLGSAVRSAIARTGAIITSCGLIMAATLGSLAASPLRLLQELGVAFVIGLLIDTFLVRPLMVPAFVVVFRRMNRGISPR